MRRYRQNEKEELVISQWIILLVLEGIRERLKRYKKRVSNAETCKGDNLSISTFLESPCCFKLLLIIIFIANIITIN